MREYFTYKTKGRSWFLFFMYFVLIFSQTIRIVYIHCILDYYFTCYRVKRYPIKLENKTSVIYNRSNTLHIYLETSWEKESWCKVLRLASSDDKERLNWFTMLNEDFQTYLKSLNSRYPSFMKPSLGLSYAEPIIDRVNRLDDSSSSKIRLFWKKLARKAPKTGLIDSKPSWSSLSSNGERRISEKTRSFQDSDPSSSSSLSKSGSHSQRSAVSDLDADDKFINDEGSLCWNLLISRLFFDAKGNAKIRRSFQERTQVYLAITLIMCF